MWLRHICAFCRVQMILQAPLPLCSFAQVDELLAASRTEEEAVAAAADEAVTGATPAESAEPDAAASSDPAAAQ